MNRAVVALPEDAPAPRPASAALATAMVAAVVARPAGAPDALTRDRALAVAPEAQARLAAIETALATPAAPDVIALWVMRIIALVGQPRDADEIELKRAALVDALSALPRRCITRASAERVARLSDRSFPALARILEIIEPDAYPLRHEARRLKAVLAAAAPPEPRATRSDAETQAMRDTAARVAAELLARARETEQALRHEDASPRRSATDLATPDDALQALARSAGPGAALARMRLAITDQRRRQGAQDAGQH